MASCDPFQSPLSAGIDPSKTPRSPAASSTTAPPSSSIRTPSASVASTVTAIAPLIVIGSGVSPNSTISGGPSGAPVVSSLVSDSPALLAPDVDETSTVDPLASPVASEPLAAVGPVDPVAAVDPVDPDELPSVSVM